MIEIILANKIVAVLSIMVALFMLVYSIIAPSEGVLAIMVLTTFYAGLVGVPALLKKRIDE